MKLQAEIDDRKREIEIKRNGDLVFAEIDGRRYELEVSEPEKGVYLFKHEGRIFEVSVALPKTPGEPFRASLRNKEFEVRIIDPKRLRSAAVDHIHGDGLAEIKTAMPGKVVRIVAAAGTEVRKGDGVIVVEAMKMQNEMKSPKDGFVKEVCVTEGVAVNAGDVLAIIE